MSTTDSIAFVKDRSKAKESFIKSFSDNQSPGDADVPNAHFVTPMGKATGQKAQPLRKKTGLFGLLDTGGANGTIFTFNDDRKRDMKDFREGVYSPVHQLKV
ncbi:hypothetical protein FRB94_010979 [Tulasnella sp. JGI-2019a]|nr:hypothetical protein FRB93_010879 [Tulasnella sp. JGI-2019a]KAG8993159.1 hypothetical protein FRB94_010979 [Tulasnella sp. JGI-2019a]